MMNLKVLSTRPHSSSSVSGDSTCSQHATCTSMHHPLKGHIYETLSEVTKMLQPPGEIYLNSALLFQRQIFSLLFLQSQEPDSDQQFHFTSFSSYLLCTLWAHYAGLQSPEMLRVGDQGKSLRKLLTLHLWLQLALTEQLSALLSSLLRDLQGIRGQILSCYYTYYLKRRQSHLCNFS